MLALPKSTVPIPAPSPLSPQGIGAVSERRSYSDGSNMIADCAIRSAEKRQVSPAPGFTCRANFAHLPPKLDKRDQVGDCVSHGPPTGPGRSWFAPTDLTGTV